MRLSIRQLEVFVQVARTNNISRAAEHLHLTQSACSMALTTLETLLGSLLFDRYGKKLIINEVGRALLPKASNLLTEFSEIQQSISNQKSLSGHLNIGASSTIGNYSLPTIITAFVEKHPSSQIKLTVGNTEQIIQQLLTFELDIAFIEGSCHHPDIEVVPWKKDQLVIVTHPKHTLAKRQNVTRKELRQEKWIMREVGSGTREEFLRAMKGNITIFLELGHTEAIKQAVKNGAGISCMSLTTVQDDLKSKNLIVLHTPELKLERDFYLLLHNNKYQTAVLKEFLAITG